MSLILPTSLNKYVKYCTSHLYIWVKNSKGVTTYDKKNCSYINMYISNFLITCVAVNPLTLNT